MTDSYKVTFDDGVTEWVTPGKKDGPPEVGDVYTQESVVERTVVHVAAPTEEVVEADTQEEVVA